MIDRLDEDEKEKLIDLAASLMKKGEKLTSVTAYGSKVAGYAREDSDYDLIITAPRFPGKVRYKYVDEPIKASALIVEDSLFLKDARQASLGEFVAGRLLNVHQPILNEAFVRRAEVESKRRVIAEILIETSSQFGEFSQDLVIPLDYFLFDKLHKRALIYPPALYSYVKTYTCSLSAENRSSSLDGFREAASTLAAQGFFNVEEGGETVRIVAEKLKEKAFARLLALLNLTTRGVRQYAVHGYAGRVGFSVFKDEAVSKVKRMKQKAEPPDELLHPKKLLRLEEGAVTAKTGELIRLLADENGFEAYTSREKSLGEVYSTARIVTIRKGKEGGGKEVNYVFKHFADIRSMKWAFLNIWSLSMKFSMSPQARMHREYYAARRLREEGVMTPRIVAVALDDRVMVKEFVDGTSLSTYVEKVLAGKSNDTTRVREYGEVLGEVHRAGFALGDSKAGNIVVKGDDLFFTDLEQAVEGGDQAWDIAEFVYYTSKLSLKESGIAAVADAFLEGYSEVNGKANISKARAQKYLNTFMPLMTPPILAIVKEELEVHAH